MLPTSLRRLRGAGAGDPSNQTRTALRQDLTCKPRSGSEESPALAGRRTDAGESIPPPSIDGCPPFEHDLHRVCVQNNTSWRRQKAATFDFGVPTGITTCPTRSRGIRRKPLGGSTIPLLRGRSKIIGICPGRRWERTAIRCEFLLAHTRYGRPHTLTLFSNPSDRPQEDGGSSRSGQDPHSSTRGPLPIRHRP